MLAEASRTAAESQKQKTQISRQLAATSRKAAEKAEAAADTEYRTKMGYSIDQYLDSLRIKNDTLKLQTLAAGIADGKKVEFIVTDVATFKPL